MDASGRRLAKARLPEGVAGMTRLHAMIGQALGGGIEADDVAAQVKIGIETDRGPWVQALVAAGYTVYPVNPLQAARYRERLALSGGQERRGRRAHAGRHGAYRLAPAAPDRRGLGRGRGGQGRGPDAQDADLGTHARRSAVAARAA